MALGVAAPPLEGHAGGLARPFGGGAATPRPFVGGRPPIGVDGHPSVFSFNFFFFFFKKKGLREKIIIINDFFLKKNIVISLRNSYSSHFLEE
jgi:hypothetical protein